MANNYKISHSSRIDIAKPNSAEGTLTCLEKVRRNTECVEHLIFIRIKILRMDEKASKRLTNETEIEIRKNTITSENKTRKVLLQNSQSILNLFDY